MSTLTVTHIDAALVDPRVFELCESFLIQEFKTMQGARFSSIRLLTKSARAYAQSVLTPMVDRERYQIPSDLSEEDRALAKLRSQSRDETALIRAYTYAQAKLHQLN